MIFQSILFIPGRYNAKAGLVTGILQICAGGSLVLLGIISLVHGSAYGSGWEIWGGILVSKLINTVHVAGVTRRKVRNVKIV